MGININYENIKPASSPTPVSSLDVSVNDNNSPVKVDIPVSSEDDLAVYNPETSPSKAGEVDKVNDADSTKGVQSTDPDSTFATGIDAENKDNTFGDNCRKLAESYYLKCTTHDKNASNDLYDSIMQDITSSNVSRVLYLYEEMNEDGGLIDSIFQETTLSKEQRGELAEHILICLIENERLFHDNLYTDDLIREFNKLIEDEVNSSSKIMDASGVNKIVDEISMRGYYNVKYRFDDEYKENFKFNGSIDADFSQGNIGDCWFLASIESIVSSPKGLDILNNNIKIINDDMVEVTLKGAGKTYIVSKDEIVNRAGVYSEGDGDVVALEIAMEKYFRETDINSEGTIEEGGFPYYAFQALLGDSGSVYFAKPDWFDFSTVHKDWNSYSDYDLGITHLKKKSQYNKIIEKVQEPDFICTVAHSKKLYDDSTSIGITAFNEEGNSVDLFYNHAYSVINSDDDFVYIVNPWDTSSTLKLTHEDFMQAFNRATMYDLNS